MECIVCGKTINSTDPHFVLRDACNPPDFPYLHICEDCADVVSPMDLYMGDKLKMANSPDDIIEVEASDIIQTEGTIII